MTKRMRRESQQLSWFVMYYSFNSNKIESYDVLAHRESDIKRLKKKAQTKDEFDNLMRREMLWYYWSKCEWELILEVDKDNHVWLVPWVGCRNPDEVRIDVTDRGDFDWVSFAQAHISNQRYKNKAKVDVFNQIEWRWSEFIDYCWYTRLKYERDDPKFHT